MPAAPAPRMIVSYCISAEVPDDGPEVKRGAAPHQIRGCVLDVLAQGFRNLEERADFCCDAGFALQESRVVLRS